MSLYVADLRSEDKWSLGTRSQYNDRYENNMVSSQTYVGCVANISSIRHIEPLHVVARSVPLKSCTFTKQDALVATLMRMY